MASDGHTLENNSQDGERVQPACAHAVFRLTSCIIRWYTGSAVPSSASMSMDLKRLGSTGLGCDVGRLNDEGASSLSLDCTAQPHTHTDSTRQPS
jgi:hypothetical protein